MSVRKLVTISAVNKPEIRVPVGSRPIEMEWAGRVEKRPPPVDFEDLTGWTLNLENGANGTLRRSREQQMWGKYVAKFTYTGKFEESRVIIKPAKPVLIPETFDCVNIWVHPEVAEEAKGGLDNQGMDKQALQLFIHLLDAKRRKHCLPILDPSALHNRMWWMGWWLVHKHLDQETRQSIIFPCSFAGLEVKGQSTSESVFFFDSLAFYQEKLKPLTFEPRPARNITLFQGHSPGLNTGPGRLSFPTREDTILPSNYESDYRNSVKRLEDGIFRFEYEGKDAKIVYVYQPRKVSLGEITAYLNGERVSRLLDGGESTSSKNI